MKKFIFLLILVMSLPAVAASGDFLFNLEFDLKYKGTYHYNIKFFEMNTANSLRVKTYRTFKGQTALKHNQVITKKNNIIKIAKYDKYTFMTLSLWGNAGYQIRYSVNYIAGDNDYYKFNIIDGEAIGKVSKAKINHLTAGGRNYYSSTFYGQVPVGMDWIKEY